MDMHTAVPSPPPFSIPCGRCFLLQKILVPIFSCHVFFIFRQKRQLQREKKDAECKSALNRHHPIASFSAHSFRLFWRSKESKKGGKERQAPKITLPCTYILPPVTGDGRVAYPTQFFSRRFSARTTFGYVLCCTPGLEMLFQYIFLPSHGVDGGRKKLRS